MGAAYNGARKGSGMSHTHIRVPKRPPHRRVWLEVTAGVALLLVPVMYWLARTHGWFVPAMDSTTGEVLETRIVLDNVRESQYGSQIYYRLEARVSYKDEGSNLRQDRWLTASEVTTTREWLIVLREKKSKVCRVYWIQNHPETAKCLLE